jgi:hypothetical protein
MSNRNYRKMGAPHFILQMTTDHDPEKADVFFVDRDGRETKLGGITDISFNAPIGGDLNWPEIELRATGMIRLVESPDGG